ncbi:MAG: tetratricopeptide repeat protein [Planctomycetota bacterium]|nr:tetratricopeptide repeat protein [Planctomycetota bacterium]
MISFFLASVLSINADAKDQTPANAKNQNLAHTKLKPSRVEKDLCLYRYPVYTSSPLCQAFNDQGLAYLYSYAWMESARSFETALKHDPDCVMAHIGLAKALDRWGKKSESTKVIKDAKRLEEKAAPNEKALLQAALVEYGLNENPPAAGEARQKAATTIIDQALSQYDDDQELWFTRAQIACNYATFGGNASSTPFYKALLKINPLHPGANHELIHFYEGQQRPALGWPHAEGYLNSSPGIHHANHMQAHLATRLGKWDKTSDRQFQHHVQTLLSSLTHDGRFKEATALNDIRPDKSKPSVAWFKFLLASRDYKGADTEAKKFLKTEKNTASYLLAILHLAQNDPESAMPWVESLQQAWATGKKEKQQEFRLWEVQGLMLAAQGQYKLGARLLKRAIDKSKNDYSHHAWGNGSIFMEKLGLIALANKDFAEAEEAFLEALAHDPGSVHAALGLRRLCEVTSRKDESNDYAKLALRCWHKADSGLLEKEWDIIRSLVSENGVPAAMR